MEKETLSKQIFGMLGETIISDRTMGDYLENSIIANLPEDESKIEEYLKPHVSILKSMDGQIRNNVANQIKDFKAKNTPATEPVTPINSQANDEKPIYVKQLEETMQSMVITVQGLQDNAKMKAEQDAKVLLQSNAKEFVKKEGATDELVLEYTLPLLTITPDMPVEELARQWKAKYNELYTKMKGKGYEPMGAGSSNPIQGKELLLSFKEQMIKEGKLPIPPPNPL